MENYQRTGALIEVTDEVRVEFYKKTYAHVAGGILLFIIAEFVFLNTPFITNAMISLLGGWSWLLLLGGFMLVTNYAESTVHRSANKQTQYLWYGIYVIAEALIFVPLIYFAIQMTNSAVLVQQAAIITIALFIGISSIVFITKKDFSFLRSALMVGGCIGIGLIIAGTIFSFNLGLWFSVGMCVLAGGSILYNTSNMVHKYTTEDYIPAALGLFASLMLLFWYILRIVMNND